MIGFRRIPCCRPFDRRHHLAGPIGIGARNRGLGFLALAIVERKDRRAVLGADIVALPVELGRIVGAEEDVEDLGIGNRRGIEFHLDRFGMAGAARTDLLVGRVLDIAADIAAFDLLDADDIVEHRLGAPEASARDNGRLVLAHIRQSPLAAEIGSALAFVIGSGIA